MNNDLISREALKKSMRKSINERYISWTKTITVADIATLIFDEIEYAPTVEPEQITIKCDTEEDKQKLLSAFRNAKLKVLNEAEITQGEWINEHCVDIGYKTAECSCCGERSRLISHDTGFGYEYEYYPFCHWCGADMGGNE